MALTNQEKKTLSTQKEMIRKQEEEIVDLKELVVATAQDGVDQLDRTLVAFNAIMDAFADLIVVTQDAQNGLQQAKEIQTDGLT